MATLLFRLPDGSEQSAELEAELTVGREGGGAELTLKDNGVSRKHCKFFVAEDGQTWVEDLNSANGTIIDGQRIAEPTPIPEGVEVALGQTTVTVQAAKKAAPRRPARPAAGGGAAANGARANGSTGLVARPKSTRMVAAAEVQGRPKAGARPVARRGAAPDDGRPRLTGTAGPWAGKAFELTKSTTVVGRSGAVDIQVDDDSVSRKHAEIYKMGNTISVRDNNSANGTFVNGDRISEAPLNPGDTVMFGVIEFSYSGPQSKFTSSAEMDKKKKILIGAGIGAGVLLLMGGLVAMQPKDTATYGNVQPDDEQPKQLDPKKLLGECLAYSDRDNEMNNWKKAVEVCGKALELDPTMSEARAKQKLARHEVDMEKLLEDAKFKANGNQDEAALSILLGIDNQSAYFARARKLFNESAERVEKRSLTECKTLLKNGYLRQAYDVCKLSLEVSCNTERGLDSEKMRLLERSAKESGRQVDFKCPPEYMRFQGGPGLMPTTMVDDSLKAIEKMYAEAEVREIVTGYYNDGRAKSASDALKRLRVKQKRKYGRTLDDTISNFDIIDGRYVSGQAYLLRTQPDNARRLWQEAMDAETRVLPPGAKSRLVKDMESQLAAEYLKIAQRNIDRDLLEEAFKPALEAYKLDPKNTAVVKTMANFERQATSALASGGCDGILRALAFTLPESQTHKQAEEAAQKQHCQ